MFERRDGRAEQKELWIVAGELPAATPDAFYRRVNRTLDEMGFSGEVWKICAPAYAEAGKGGRPGIDPVVYMKMLMVGFFENLPSERAIASRCADSLSLRGFLGYSLTEATPDHSSLSVIRRRLSLEQFQDLHLVLLRALREHGLLKGRHLGIDSSVIEANASLRELQQRNTQQKYWDYVKDLAAQAGIDPGDTKSVRQFDRKREGRKTSNRDWVNPHDPEAKVGRTKDGATDMVYKPEHVSDLESGAIVEVEVRPGDAADNDDTMAQRVLCAVGTLVEVVSDPAEHESLGETVTGDEGFFALKQIAQLHQSGVRTIIADPQAGRRRQDLPAEDRKTLRRAARATVSASGKALLRKRGEHLERGFAHVLDHGGLRRATLRGCENLTKRHLAAALSFNLSLLLRTIFGVGTSKQWLAGAAAALCLVATVLCLASDILRRLLNRLLGPPPSPFRRSLPSAGFAPGLPFGHIHLGPVGFSTGC